MLDLLRRDRPPDGDDWRNLPVRIAIVAIVIVVAIVIALVSIAVGNDILDRAERQQERRVLGTRSEICCAGCCQRAMMIAAAAGPCQ